MASNPFEAKGAVGHSPPKKAKEDATLKNTATLKKAESIMLTSSEVDSRICIDCDPGYVYCSLNALKTHKSTKKHLDKVARNLQPPRDGAGEESEREVQRERDRMEEEGVEAENRKGIELPESGGEDNEGDQHHENTVADLGGDNYGGEDEEELILRHDRQVVTALTGATSTGRGEGHVERDTGAIRKPMSRIRHGTPHYPPPSLSTPSRGRGSTPMRPGASAKMPIVAMTPDSYNVDHSGTILGDTTSTNYIINQISSQISSQISNQIWEANANLRQSLEQKIDNNQMEMQIQTKELQNEMVNLTRKGAVDRRNIKSHDEAFRAMAHKQDQMKAELEGLQAVIRKSVEGNGEGWGTQDWGNSQFNTSNQTKAEAQEMMEDIMRRKANLVMTGMEEREDETQEELWELVVGFLKSKLEIAEDVLKEGIVHVRRLGNKNRRSGYDRRRASVARPVLMVFKSIKFRDLIDTGFQYEREAISKMRNEYFEKSREEKEADPMPAFINIKADNPPFLRSKGYEVKNVARLCNTYSYQLNGRKFGCLLQGLSGNLRLVLYHDSGRGGGQEREATSRTEAETMALKILTKASEDCGWVKLGAKAFTKMGELLPEFIKEPLRDATVRVFRNQDLIQHEEGEGSIEDTAATAGRPRTHGAGATFVDPRTPEQTGPGATAGATGWSSDFLKDVGVQEKEKGPKCIDMISALLDGEEDLARREVLEEDGSGFC